MLLFLLQRAAAVMSPVIRSPRCALRLPCHTRPFTSAAAGGHCCAQLRNRRLRRVPHFDDDAGILNYSCQKGGMKDTCPCVMMMGSTAVHMPCHIHQPRISDANDH